MLNEDLHFPITIQTSPRSLICYCSLVQKPADLKKLSAPMSRLCARNACEPRSVAGAAVYIILFCKHTSSRPHSFFTSSHCRISTMVSAVSTHRPCVVRSVRARHRRWPYILWLCQTRTVGRQHACGLAASFDKRPQNAVYQNVSVHV